MAEDEIVGWHHRLNGHESEQAPGDSDGQGSLFMGSQRVGHNLVTQRQKNSPLGESGQMCSL